MFQKNKTLIGLDSIIKYINSHSHWLYIGSIAVSLVTIELMATYTKSPPIIKEIVSLFVLLAPLVWLHLRDQFFIDKQLRLLAGTLSSISKGENITSPFLPIDVRWSEINQATLALSNYLRLTNDQLRTITSKLNAFGENLSLTTKNAERGVQLISRIIQDVARGTETQEENIRDVSVDAQSMMNMIQNMGIAAGTQVDALEKTENVIKLNAAVMRELTIQAEYQADEIQKTRVITSQISEAIHEVSKETFDIAEFSNETRQVATHGEEVVNETLDTMATIQKMVIESAETVRELGESSHQIFIIIEFIDELSKQTHLLSINAAIEAARAGEQGLGFAVVADEVRKLAERSTEATKKIARLIEKIQEYTEKAENIMQKSCTVVLKGEKHAKAARTALSNIIEGVKNTVSQIENISASAEQVTASSDEVVSTTNNIANVIKNNSKAIHDFTISFKEIENLMQQAKDISIINQKTATEMVDKYEVTHEKVHAVQEVAKRNSILATEANNGNQKMSFLIAKYAKHVDEINEQFLQTGAKKGHTD